MALPGIQTVIVDHFQSISRSDVPGGPIVVAIGSRSVDHPDGTNGAQDFDPYSPAGEADVVASFGAGSQMHRAYLELLTGGVTSIVLVPLPAGTVDADLLVTSLNNVFDKAFDAAETVNPSIIVPWGRGGHPDEWTAGTGFGSVGPATPSTPPPFGFYADNSALPGSSLLERVANKCQAISANSTPCFAIMGVKPWVGTSTAAKESILTSDLNTHLALPNLASVTDPGFANGMYVSVIGTELVPSGVTADFNWGPRDFGYSNGACSYAGALTQLASYNAATQQPVFNIIKLRFNPTATMQQSLINKSVVPVALDFNRVPRFIDSMTFAPNTSDYTRLTTLRIAFDAIKMVRNVSLQFIGKGATQQIRNALETAITSGLRNMTQVGALLNSDFVVTYDPAANSADVNLVLTPAFEIRNINLSVSVSL